MAEISGSESSSIQNLNDIQNYIVTFNKEIQGETIPVIVPVEMDEDESKEESPAQDESKVASEAGPSTPIGRFYREQAILEDESVDNSPLMQGIVSTMEQNVEGAQFQEYCDMTEDNSTIEGLEVPVLAQEINSTLIQSLISNQNVGNVIKIVSVGVDGQMQFVSEEFAKGAELVEFPKELLAQTTESIEQSEMVNSVDPVAVLSAIASNTSTSTSLLQIGQNDLHNAKLVALQNAADSSQPQLVAVQTGGNVDDTLQVLGEAGEGVDNSVIFSAINSFQTVAIVPSEVGKDGEVSYVLIVTQPDGDKVDKSINAENLSLFCGANDITTEEIVDENGTTKKILKLIPRRTFTQDTGEQLFCHYCTYTSPKRYLLARHMKTHSEDRPYKCSICDRGFKTMASLTNHVNTHTGVRPHKCKDCESMFTTSGELVRHIRYKHTFEKPHKCMTCDYASVELSKLKRHMRSHTGERPYQCPQCSYASPDTYKLKRHLRIHTGEKPYGCDICNARFTQSNSLKAHKLIHTGDKPVYQCELCPTTCGRKTDLKIHVQKLHTRDRLLICRRCNQSFNDRYTFKVHLKDHDGEKCFKCTFYDCFYAAISQRHLDSHMLTHSGEKPYACDECDQAFRQKQLLKRHKSIHHASSEEFNSSLHVCAECDKIFSSKASLSRHMREHGIISIADEVEGIPVMPQVKDNLHSNIMQDWKAGKLGASPQVVIVHPDGSVEEFSSKAGMKNVDDLLTTIEGSEEVTVDKSTEKVDILSEIIFQTEKKKEAGTQVVIDSDTDDDIEMQPPTKKCKVDKDKPSIIMIPELSEAYGSQPNVLHVLDIPKQIKTEPAN